MCTQYSTLAVNEKAMTPFAVLSHKGNASLLFRSTFWHELFIFDSKKQMV
jgi:hypothetical protein